ncbi:MAG: molybdate ABC transporter ATP-binding protein ModF [Pseudomonadales bacterium]|nr:molybdate ABC transporter ATP-binding protein ModF [Pseudomonadales bacterium]NRA17710.1 molybdate ABC transporter ATP-binding protein ModF [Oceanospirillaceae bacterium]
MKIQLQNCQFDFEQRFQLKDINWQIQAGQHWVITGANGSGKSALVATLAGFGDKIAGTVEGLVESVAIVSFEAQAALIERERKKDDADILDVIAVGTAVHEILAEGDVNASIVEDLVEKFALKYLLDRPFRALSTGETRKVLLIHALATEPKLLLLDEPFDGLDADTLIMLQRYLAELSHSVSIVMVLNRCDEIPQFITHLGYMRAATLAHSVARADESAYRELFQLLHLETSDLQIPPTADSSAKALLNPDQPLVVLNDIGVKYDQLKVLENFNWQIDSGQHWQLCGPNGSGKTAILSLITGDHPQCYSNDIFVFGFNRGNGESIWQIKQFIGYVSTALQWEYRVGTSLRNVIVSGFYDSIGLYSKATDKQRKIADQWLALLGMEQRADQSFNKLSFGDQRLLLIARAMVKHPPLLILDEPCLGLDDINRQLVLALIEKICAAGLCTVLYVNHHSEDTIAGIENYKNIEKNSTNID